ncbi:MAG: NAD(P)H-dependent oxidoreductase [Marmoricola sp.]
MKVLVLLGSTREGSVNKSLAEAALAELPEGATGTIFEGLADLPFYDDVLEANVPEAVARLRAAVAESDALILATPEYNGSVSAVLKNAVDWASRPYGNGSIAGKPALVLAASPSPNGAKWAREDLVKILKVAQAVPLEEHFGHANAFDGINDEHRTELGRLVGSLHEQVAA